MFSKLTHRTASALRTGAQFRCFSQASPRACAVAVSDAGTDNLSRLEQTKAMKAELGSRMAQWSEAHALYNSPERDYVNFPVLEMPKHTVGFRLMIVPEYWFDAFYKHSGVTGPYMLTAGILTFLISKEYVVLYELLLITIVGGLLARNLNLNSMIGKRQDRDKTPGYFRNLIPPLLADVLAKNEDDLQINGYEKHRALDIETTKSFIAEIDTIVTQEAGKKYIYEAYKENVDMQLEERYRTRLEEINAAVKKRLDFQIALDTTKRNFEQNHMVNHIVDSVRKSITAQQEQDVLAKCFTDLKMLAAAQKA